MRREYATSGKFDCRYCSAAAGSASESVVAAMRQAGKGVFQYSIKTKCALTFPSLPVARIEV